MGSDGISQFEELKKDRKFKDENLLGFENREKGHRTDGCTSSQAKVTDRLVSPLFP